VNFNCFDAFILIVPPVIFGGFLEKQVDELHCEQRWASNCEKAKTCKSRSNNYIYAGNG